jgi:hypothetical protein
MIGLPDGVGTRRLWSVYQVEGFGIGLRPYVGQGHQGRGQLADQVIDGLESRWRLPELLGENDGLAMDGRHGQRREKGPLLVVYQSCPLFPSLSVRGDRSLLRMVRTTLIRS